MKRIRILLLVGVLTLAPFAGATTVSADPGCWSWACESQQRDPGDPGIWRDPGDPGIFRDPGDPGID